jgi:hypothetical protein
MRLALTIITTRYFPQPDREQWQELRSELAPKNPIRFGEGTWPADGDWPEALFYVQFSGGREIHISEFDDDPTFATEVAAARRWCIETLSPRVGQVSAEIALAQETYRNAIIREAEAIVLGGLATSQKKLYIWLPLAVRMMRLYEAVNSMEALNALSPQYWPEGEVAATVNITIYERLCFVAQALRDAGIVRWFYKESDTLYVPAPVSRIAHWLDETRPFRDYIGIASAMQSVDRIIAKCSAGG